MTEQFERSVPEKLAPFRSLSAAATHLEEAAKGIAELWRDGGYRLREDEIGTLKEIVRNMERMIGTVIETVEKFEEVNKIK